MCVYVLRTAIIMNYENNQQRQWSSRDAACETGKGHFQRGVGSQSFFAPAGECGAVAVYNAQGWAGFLSLSHSGGRGTPDELQCLSKLMGGRGGTAETPKPMLHIIPSCTIFDMQMTIM